MTQASATVCLQIETPLHTPITMLDSSLILGIDPGTCVTGYGIIENREGKYRAIDYGCIRPPAALPLSQRYRVIFEGLCHLLQKYTIHALAVETQFVGKNAQSAIKLGMARGVSILAATLQNVPIFEYSPSQAKLAVVGNGGASKDQVQRMTQMLLKLQQLPQPQDASDALALAICHAQACRNIKIVGERL